MEHKENKTTEVLTLVNVTCDCCGKSCGKPGEPQYTQEYMTMKANWGYYSNKDLQFWEAHICESCIDEKFGFVNFIKTNSISGKLLNDK